MHNDDERRHIEALFESLSPEERRGRLLVLPEYENKRDELLQPERIVAQFQYFWDHWVPMLGPGPSMVYMKLRQFTYYNRQTGELREEVSKAFPKQQDIARSLGMERKTLMRHLETLEDHGLLVRKGRTRFSNEHGKQVRTTDVYSLKIVDILTPEHQVEVLIGKILKPSKRRSNQQENQALPEMSQKRTFQDPPVDNLAEMSQKRTFLSCPKNGQLLSVPLSLPTNVERSGKTSKSETGPTSLMLHPQVQSLTGQQRETCERTAFEIGEQLKRMAGDRSEADHKSAGFHRRVAFLLPERLVQEALMSTRDALEDSHSGRKRLTQGPAAYFAGAVRRIAEREGIDLGIDWSDR